MSSSSVIGCASPTFSSTDPASSSFHHPILHPFASSPASGAQVRGPSLSSLGTFAPHPSAPPAIEVTAPSPNIEKKQARVLYDYEAKDLTEISLTEDELICVHHLPSLGADYMMAEKGHQRGKVPITHLQLLN